MKHPKCNECYWYKTEWCKYVKDIQLLVFYPEECDKFTMARTDKIMWGG